MTLNDFKAIEGDREILPGLFARVTGGHTKMHQIVVIDSGSEGAVFWVRIPLREEE